MCPIPPKTLKLSTKKKKNANNTSCRQQGAALPHQGVLPAVAPLRLHQVLLAAEAEVLDGLGHTAQRAVDLLRVQVLAVELQQAVVRHGTDFFSVIRLRLSGRDSSS